MSASIPRTRIAVAFAAALACTSAGAAEVVLDALEDTWIDGLGSATTHGGEPTVAICPVANYWMYFKFDLATIGGTVTDAELRLTRFGGDRPEEISIYLITEDTWSEGTLSGQNRPAPASPSNAAALANGVESPGYDRWTSAALTAAVVAEQAGDGTLSLMVRENPAQMLDIRYYRSTEADVPPDERPRLVVDCITDEIGPVEATSVVPTTFAWSSGAGWDVIGGTLADLRVDGGVLSATCLADALS